MKIKLIIALVALIAGNALIPNFKSTTVSATFVNTDGQEELCKFNWGGIGFGKSLSDGKFEACIEEKKKNGFTQLSNEKTEVDLSLLNWLLFT